MEAILPTPMIAVGARQPRRTKPDGNVAGTRGLRFGWVWRSISNGPGLARRKGLARRIGRMRFDYVNTAIMEGSMTFHRKWMTAAVVFVSMAIATCSATAQKRYAPGISDNEIKIGQTMPYSGPASSWGTVGRAELA